MAEDQDEYTFPSEDLEKLIQETIEPILGPRTYDERQVQAWIN